MMIEWNADALARVDEWQGRLDGRLVAVIRRAGRRACVVLYGPRPYAHQNPHTHLFLGIGRARAWCAEHVDLLTAKAMV
jgi:hypothetical protein